MRSLISIELESCRVRQGIMRSSPADGMNGAFYLPYQNEFGSLIVVVSDGMGWDHVSVSTPKRCPTWEEMKHVKQVFFKDDEAAFQIYPPEALYRNCHPFCLHWWRPQDKEIPLPEPLMVAP